MRRYSEDFKAYVMYRIAPLHPGLIQSVSQALLPLLSAWVEVGGIASSLCLTALLLQPISI